MASVRLATPDDAASVAAIYEPVVQESAISFETEPPDVAEMRGRIEETLPAYPWLVCEGDGVMGYAYAGPHRSRDAYRWSVDVSVYVAAAARRRGVGSALYESLFALLRSQGFVNAYAGVALPNPASVALHESLGFEPVGTYEGVGYKDGEWHDVSWWHRSLNERERNPAPPVAVDSLADDAVAAAVATGETNLEPGP